MFFAIIAINIQLLRSKGIRFPFWCIGQVAPLLCCPLGFIPFFVSFALFLRLLRFPISVICRENLWPVAP